MKNYLMIAEVLKPQGIRGEVKLKPYTADITSFAGWKTLFLAEKDTFTPISAKVTRIHEGNVYVILGDCASMEDAEKFRGRQLYIDRAHVQVQDPDAVLIADLIGCIATDENGNTVGTLTDVLQYGTVDTYVFRTPRGTMMAPALLKVFPRVDPEAGTISVCSEKLREVAVFED